MRKNSKKFEDLSKKLFLFYKRIILKSLDYPTNDERVKFLEKVIKDFDKIISEIEYGDCNNDTLILNNAGKEYVDENFIMLADENVSDSIIDDVVDLDGNIPLCLVMELVNKNDSTLVYKIDKLNEMKISLRLDKEKMSKMFKSNKEVKTMRGQKYQIKSSLSDIVRIFEGMKESGIISKETTVRQIAEIFNDETDDITAWERNYNATKSRIRNNQGHARSNYLRNFIKILVEAGYKANDIDLDELIRFLEKKQNSVI